MNRLIQKLTIASLLFAALLSGLFWLDLRGFMSESIEQMWARAIVQIEGPPRFRATEAFYPPLPYTMTLILQQVRPGNLLPTPLLLSAALSAAMLLAWYANLRERGELGRGAALIILVLLAFNPLFIRAVAEGPNAVLLLFGFWIYARGLLNLRLNGAAPDMMKVAVGLLVMPLSHSYGILLALGTLPFIVISARPSMLAMSSTGYLTAMFFPVLAAIGSLSFVSFVLNTEFFSSSFVRGGAPSPASGLTPLALSLCLPLAALIRLILLPRYALPILAGIGSLAGGATLNLAYGFENDSVIVATPVLGLCVVAVRSWPLGSMRVGLVCALLATSLPLAILGMRSAGSSESQRMVKVLSGQTVADPRTLNRDLAKVLAGRQEILVDIERHPGLVAAIGDIQSFLITGDPDYDITIEGGRPRGDYLLVRQDLMATAQDDRLLRAFPQLADGEAEPFDLLYSRNGWRLFEINR
ncbi:hypothetical protein EU805_12605 [Salipiger sp. IMCC34102]|uniref:hypothetical protein n=1 Tax=Salipiger sp. IMCC34102 TaxID=2510647 RepID=UPI00101C4D23|nr:hypothetical protein [Salipiger sp. IMCC34102]RYH02015.1 hypothetical protein EU805_12605 [Salipiger sp. IMCC34102]